MKKIRFFVLLITVLMAMTMLFTSCDKTAPSTQDNGSSPSETTQCEHNYTSKVTTEATCTKDGVKTFTCSVCNDSYTEAIAATGKHNYTSKVTTEATCTKDGVRTFTCSVCNDSYTEAIAATGKHNYASKVTTEATCTKDGVKTFTCSMCKNSYTESIAAGHKWTNATCTAPKTCSVCKLTEGDALGHKMESSKCTRCGVKISVVLYEDSTVKITFKKAEKYKYSNDRVELYFYVENKTGKTLLIQADAVSLNGYSFCKLIMSDEVAANSIGTVNLSVEDFDFNLVNLESIFSLGGQFRIIDDATWKSYDAVFTNVKLDGTGIGSKPVNFSSDNFLYTDNNCEIYYKSIAKYPYSSDRVELYFYIVNKTKKTLLIQADTISINGYGFSNLIMSAPVLPDTIGIINLSVKDFDFELVDISNITKIGGQFRIIDDATWKSYDAIFPQSGGATGSTSNKWSYSEASDLNAYANKATTNAQKAWDYAIDAMTASSTYKVLYNQYAVYYAGIAKGYLESMKAIADSNADLTLTNTNGKYSTLQEKIDYAYELCDEIVNLQITSSNYATYEDKILDITKELSLECLGIQKLSVDLIGAFAS